MSHPSGQDPTQDTPPQAPEADIDWQKRYLDLQPEYTRTTQELSQLRKLAQGEDEEGFAKLLEQYGYELPEQEDPEPEDPEDPSQYEDPEPAQVNDPRLEQFEQFMQQEQERQAQQHAQEQWDGWAQYVQEQAKEAGVELTAREVKGLQLDCVGPDGLPVAPAKAAKVLKDYIEDERVKWVESLTASAQPRQRPRAPHVPQGGQPTTRDGKDPANMTLAEKTAYAMERLQAEQS